MGQQPPHMRGPESLLQCFSLCVLHRSLPVAPGTQITWRKKDLLWWAWGGAGPEVRTQAERQGLRTAKPAG